MQLNYHQYLMEPASRRFKAFEDHIQLEAIFNFLQSDTQVRKMKQATMNKRPALEGVIEAIEAKYPRAVDFDLLQHLRQRQILGSMTRYIMGRHGYFPGKVKAMKKGRYIKTAIVFSKK